MLFVQFIFMLTKNKPCDQCNRIVTYLPHFVSRNMKMRNKCVWIIFLLSILCSPMIATAPEYVECENLYPDEFLDLFGIPENSVTSSAIPRLRSYVSSFCDLRPTHAFQCHHLENPYPQPAASGLILSVSLRC